MTVAPASSGRAGDLSRDLEAVHVRHVRVEQDELERPLGRRGRDRARRRRPGRSRPSVGVMPQRATCSARMRRLTSLSSTISTSRCGRPGSACGASGASATIERHGEVKRAAGARLALDPDASAHQPHERGRDGQAETGAAEPARRRSVRLAERLEDRRRASRRDADPGVGDAEMQLVLPSLRESSRTATNDVAALGELERVADQVRQDLLEARRVADDAGGHVRVDVADQLEPLLVGPEGERLERARRSASRGENGTASSSSLRDSIFEKSRMSLRIDSSDVGRRAHRGQAVALFGGELAVEHEVGHADDAVHRRPDFVAHVREELALRAAGFHRPVARRHQFLVARLELGGAHVDRVFELVLLHRASCWSRALDVAQHRVELVDQLADFVGVAWRRADVVAAAVPHRSRHLDQPRDRFEDQLRDLVRQGERNPEAAERA